MIRMLGAPKIALEKSKGSWLRSSEPEVDVVSNAIVPPATRHSFPAFETPGAGIYDGWKGGVYDQDGKVVPSSLLDRRWTRVTVAYAPNEIGRENAIRIVGQAMFGGLLITHFGHFLLESTTRLWWAIREGFKGKIIFQAIGDVPPFAKRFFELLGIADQIVIADRPIEAESIVVPHRTFAIQSFSYPEFRIPFLAAGKAAEAYSLDVVFEADAAFLSRRMYEFRRTVGEDVLEEIFAYNGYAVVHMETMPLEQQILVIRKCKRLAGITGSAFHSMLFSEDPKQVTYLCRDADLNANYLMIDELLNTDATYIFHKSETGKAAARGYSEDLKINLRKIGKHLETIGYDLTQLAVHESAQEPAILKGDRYSDVLQRLHKVLKPKSYFEIGSATGASLIFAECPSIAVDPKFALKKTEVVTNKPSCALYQKTSDEFFASVNPAEVLGRPIDLAFLDGMHLSEFLYRDFMNTERFCARNSIIAMHDCVPLDLVMAEREWPAQNRQHPSVKGWWAGDVWRFALLLKRKRPELSITVLDAPPTGLILVTNLDPESMFLQFNYNAFMQEMLAMSLFDITVEGLRNELNMQSTADLQSFEQISARFWF